MLSSPTSARFLLSLLPMGFGAYAFLIYYIVFTMCFLLMQMRSHDIFGNIIKIILKNNRLISHLIPDNYCVFKYIEVVSHTKLKNNVFFGYILLVCYNPVVTGFQE